MHTQCTLKAINSYYTSDDAGYTISPTTSAPTKTPTAAPTTSPTFTGTVAMRTAITVTDIHREDDALAGVCKAAGGGAPPRTYTWHVGMLRIK